MKQITNMLLVASGVILIMLSSFPELVSAHRRVRSCDRSFRQIYPRRYDYHRGDCSTTRSYRPHRRYTTAMDIIDELIRTNTNSLARQQKRNVAVSERHQLSRFIVEDYESLR